MSDSADKSSDRTPAMTVEPGSGSPPNVADDPQARETVMSDTVTALRSNSINKVEMISKGLTNLDSIQLANAMPNCTCLLFLALRNNNIGDHGAEAIGRALPHCPQLYRVLLFGNNIGDRGAITIAEGLRKSQVGMMTLSDNRIGPLGAAAVGAAARDSKAVYLVSLRTNPLLDEGLEALASCLPQAPDTNSWRILATDQSGGTDRGVQALAKALISSTMQEFHYLDTNISEAGALSLGEMLRVNVHLTSLRLTDINLGDKGAILFGNALSRNLKLKKFNISKNNIGNACAEALSRGLKKTICLWQPCSCKVMLLDRMARVRSRQMWPRRIPSCS
eukprot:m.2673 g.2673  ORF g.2673 m.2673 type:complete len:335 (-) comp1494_c0_seq1:1361-2365(-)